MTFTSRLVVLTLALCAAMGIAQAQAPSQGRVSRSAPTSERAYGFIGDAVAASGITTTRGSVTFGGLSLSPRDVGKAIIVPGAGPNGDPLTTRIATPTTFASAAGETTRDWLLFAPLGANCPVATAQRGTGNYAAGDAITLDDGGMAHVVCAVQYAQIVSASVVNGGSGCANGTFLVRTTTGTSSSNVKASISVAVVGNTIAAVNGIAWGGRFTVNPASPAFEPVSGAGCVGAVLSLKMGVAIARVTSAGLLTGGAPGRAVAQALTSGGGTGAAFDMSTVWKSRASGTAGNDYLYSTWYGTDNSAAMTALAAATTSPTVQFEAGTYLVNCGQYNFSSAASLVGAGQDRTKFKLFPFCLQQDQSLLRWVQRPGARVASLTIDAGLARNSSPNVYRTFTSIINNIGSSDFRVENLNIINLANRVGGVVEQSSGTSPLANPYFHNLYFTYVRPDTTADVAFTLGDAGHTGVTGARGDHLRSIGGQTSFCTNGGVYSDFEISGLAFGAGVFTQAGNPNCHDEAFSNIRVHDSLHTLDIDQTSNGGIEADGPAIHVTGLWAWNLGGDGARCASSNSSWQNITVWDNGAMPIFGAAATGFNAIGVKPGQICNNAAITGLKAYDSGKGVQKFGYSETVSPASGPLSGVTVAGALSGAAGAYRLSHGSNTRIQQR